MQVKKHSRSSERLGSVNLGEALGAAGGYGADFEKSLKTITPPPYSATKSMKR
jgi:hypothetical protein